MRISTKFVTCGPAGIIVALAVELLIVAFAKRCGTVLDVILSTVRNSNNWTLRIEDMTADLG